MQDPLDAWITSGARPHRQRGARRPNVVRVFWDSIREPRHIKVTYWVLYLVELLGGIGLLADPPQTIAGELGPLLTITWAVGFVIGGSVGLCTVLGGWWKVEKLGLWCALGSIGIYAGVVGYLHFTSSGSRVMQLTIIAFGVGLFLVRFLMIRGRDFEPRGQA